VTTPKDAVSLTKCLGSWTDGHAGRGQTQIVGAGAFEVWRADDGQDPAEFESGV